MKKKTFLMGLYVAVVYGIVIFSMTSCNDKTELPKKTATEVVNHNDKDIIIETLHQGRLNRGVYKMMIDSNDYIVIINNGTAIIKHN